MKQAIYKVPGGKLLKIFVQADEVIQDIKITGDFFIYPEDSIEFIESALKGAPMEEAALTKITAKATKDVELFGLDVDSIVHTILMTQS